MSDNGKMPPITLVISLDEDGITQIEPSEGADLFSLIAMIDAAHQMVMSQYFGLAAAKIHRREQFAPKLLVPQKGGI